MNISLLIKHSLYFMLCISTLVQASSFKHEVQNLIHKNIPESTVSVLIKDQEQNKVIYSKNADKLLMPASGSKLFPAAAAIYQWPDNYYFNTSLSKKNEDYYLTFTGSPSLTRNEFYELLNYWVKNNIHTITGNIILDISRLKPPYYPSGTSLDDLGWYYAAPDTSIIIDKNAISYKFITSKKIGGPIQIIPEQTNNFLQIINQTITVSPEYAHEHCEMHVSFNDNNQIKIYGCMAQTNNPKGEKLAIPNPILYTENLIKEFLKANNIELQGDVKTGITPKNVKELQILPSDDLFTIIKHMLQESDNVYASAITKQLGYAITHEGSNKQGIFAIKEILKKHINLNEDELRISDGVGTRYNLVTSQQIVNLLTSVYADQKIGKIFWNSLPVSGKFGTLTNRMQNSILTGKVFAKTGSMHDVSSLSGYIINAKGKVITFSIIANNINSNTGINNAKIFEEKILSYIYHNT